MKTFIPIARSLDGREHRLANQATWEAAVGALIVWCEVWRDVAATMHTIEEHVDNGVIRHEYTI